MYSGVQKLPRVRGGSYTGWPTSSAEMPPAMKPYASFAVELAISGGLVSKGHRVNAPLPARDDILHRLHSSHIGISG